MSMPLQGPNPPAPEGRPPQPGDERLISTGEAARLLKVAPRTVAMWFDKGRLRGARIGSGVGERRIDPESVRKLAADCGLTLEIPKPFRIDLDKMTLAECEEADRAMSGEDET